MSFFSTERVLLRANQARAYRAHCQDRFNLLANLSGFIRSRTLELEAPQHNYQWNAEWVDRSHFESAKEVLKNLDLRSEALSDVLKGAQWEFSELVHHGDHRFKRDFRSSYLDSIVEDFYAQESPEQIEIRETSRAQGLPAISIGALEGRLIELLLKSIGARRGVELGSLGGYSASWILRALGPEGHLVSIESHPKHYELTQQNLATHIQESRLEVVHAKAMDALESRDWPSLDFAFIDADKTNYPNYLRFLIPRIRKGGLIIIDNAFLWGAMSLYKKGMQVPAFSEESRLYSIERDCLDAMADTWELLKSKPELQSMIIPTGDGLGVALKV